MARRLGVYPRNVRPLLADGIPLGIKLARPLTSAPPLIFDDLPSAFAETAQFGVLDPDVKVSDIGPAGCQNPEEPISISSHAFAD